MSITVQCGRCQKRYTVDDKLAGKKAKCRSCGYVMNIPAAAGDIPALAPDNEPAGPLPVWMEGKDPTTVEMPKPAAPGAGRPARAKPPQPDEDVSLMALLAQDRGEPGSAADGAEGGEVGLVGVKARRAEGDVYHDILRETVVSRHTLRRNVLPSYPFAALVDEWLPLLLVLLGAGPLVLSFIRQMIWGEGVWANYAKKVAYTWFGSSDGWATTVALLILVTVAVVVYTALIIPITLMGMKLAGRILRFELPDSASYRLFAVYLWPVALGNGFSFLSVAGGWEPFIMGWVLGLLTSFFPFWLIFRLRFVEAAVSYPLTGVFHGVSLMTVVLTLTLVVSGLAYFRAAPDQRRFTLGAPTIPGVGTPDQPGAGRIGPRPPAPVPTGGQPPTPPTGVQPPTRVQPPVTPPTGVQPPIPVGPPSAVTERHPSQYLTVPAPPLPAPPTFTVLEPGVRFAEVSYPGGDQPGWSGKLWVYLPEGKVAVHALPCVLIAPAAANLTTGVALGPDDRAEHLPYVKAGFAVIAYEIDGAGRGDPQKLEGAELARATRAFQAALGGLVNVRNALAYALSPNLPEIDPQRVFLAGRGPAGGLALLFAEHEPRVHAVVAYGPRTDVIKGIDADTMRTLEALAPGTAAFAAEFAPFPYAVRLQCPVYLFHARDDQTVPVDQTLTFAEQLKQSQRPHTLALVDAGGHRGAMLSQGIPGAVRWMQELDGARAGGTPGTPAAPPDWKAAPDPPARVFRLARQNFQSKNFPERYARTVVFPSRPSALFSVGETLGPSDVRLTASVVTGGSVGGQIKGPLTLHEPMALHPEGTFFAAVTAQGRPVEVTAWVCRNGQALPPIQVQQGDGMCRWLDFAGANQLVVYVAGTNGEQLDVWDCEKGNRLVSLKSIQDIEVKSLTISPGGKHLALVTRTGGEAMLSLCDLATGTVLGRVPVPKTDKPGPFTGRGECQGLAFAPDGTELAGVFGGAFQAAQIVAWKLATGEVTFNKEVNRDNRDSVFEAKNHALEWLEDGQGWLLQGRSIVDRRSGDIIWTLTELKDNFSVLYRLLDNYHLMVVSEASMRTTPAGVPIAGLGVCIVKTVPLPMDKINKARPATTQP